MDSIIITIIIKDQPQCACDIEIPVQESAEKAALDILECLNALWPEQNVNAFSCRLISSRTQKVLRGSETVAEQDILNGDIFYLD